MINYLTIAYNVNLCFESGTWVSVYQNMISYIRMILGEVFKVQMSIGIVKVVTDA